MLNIIGCSIWTMELMNKEHFFVIRMCAVQARGLKSEVRCKGLVHQLRIRSEVAGSVKLV